jgi:hypothetical protein
MQIGIIIALIAIVGFAGYTMKIEAKAHRAGSRSARRRSLRRMRSSRARPASSSRRRRTTSPTWSRRTTPASRRPRRAPCTCSRKGEPMSTSIRTCFETLRARCLRAACASSTRLALACAVILLLTGCATTPIAVQAPALDLPPIPPRLMEACEEPAPLKKGTLEEMYLAMLEDAGPWGRCVRAHDRLIEVVKYRTEVEKKWREQAAKSPRPWWKLWGD